MDPKTAMERLLFSIVRIEVDKADGQHCGTAFFYSLRDGDKDRTFIITNYHVVEGAVKARFFFTLREDGKALLGKKMDIQMEWDKDWLRHPSPSVDLAAMLVDSLMNEVEKILPIHPFISFIQDGLIPTDEAIAEFDAL